jgi:ABC-type multidrug transport system fused ATPase/permease subunit
MAGLLSGVLGAGRGLDIHTFKVVWTPETLALVGLAATATKGVGATLSATLQSRLAQKVVTDVRRDSAAALLAGGSDLPAGLLSARLAVRLAEIEVGVRDGFLGGLRALLTLLPLAVALVLLSSKLALGAALIVLPFAAATSLARKKWRKVHAHALSLREGLHRQIDELVVHMDVWRTFGAEHGVCAALDGLGARSAAASGRADGLRAAISGLNEFLAAAALLFAVLAAHTISPASEARLIAFCAVVFMSYRPLRDLSDARGALERGAGSLAAVEEAPKRMMPRLGAESVAASEVASDPARSAVTASSRSEATDVSTSATPIRFWGREPLVVQGLEVVRPRASPMDSLADPNDGRPQAHPGGVTFVAEPGEIVAIVGATGAGKTTLLRALLGLEPEAVGSVRYAGEELIRRGVGPGERPFAWVPQEAPIIAGTLADNVVIGGEHRPADAERDALVDELLQKIGAIDLARRCGTELLGAAGRPVSGGERKWICLARALATRLPVLLLDEPTAGLDAQSEKSLLEALHRLRDERTIVLVTHQAEPLKIADRVVRLGPAFQNWERNRTSFSNSSRMSGMS